MPNPETSNMNKTIHCKLCWDGGHDGGYCCIDDCKCHSQGKPETWEEEFDKVYPVFEGFNLTSHRFVKSFIRKQIEAARKEEWRKVKIDLYSYLKTDLPKGLESSNLEIMEALLEAARKEGILSVVEMIPDYLDTNTDSGGYDTEILKEEIKKGLL